MGRGTTGPLDPVAMQRMQAADKLLKWIQSSNGQVLVDVVKVIEDKRESESSQAQAVSTVYCQTVGPATTEAPPDSNVRNPWDAKIAANGRATIAKGGGRKAKQNNISGGGGGQAPDKAQKKAASKRGGGSTDIGETATKRGKSSVPAPPPPQCVSQSYANVHRTGNDMGSLLAAASMTTEQRNVPAPYVAPQLSRVREERGGEGRENRNPLAFYAMTNNGYHTPSGSRQPIQGSSSVMPELQVQYQHLQARMINQYSNRPPNTPYSWMR